MQYGVLSQNSFEIKHTNTTTTNYNWIYALLQKTDKLDLTSLCKTDFAKVMKLYRWDFAKQKTVIITNISGGTSIIGANKSPFIPLEVFSTDLLPAENSLIWK